MTVITLPLGGYGLHLLWTERYSQPGNLFTVSFMDISTPTVTDPTGMSQLDRYEITVSAPYSTFGWLNPWLHASRVRLGST